MWVRIARVIIVYKLPLTILVVLSTLFMSLHVTDVEINHDFISAIPDNHGNMKEFLKFKKQFGEDGNIIAIGMNDSSLFELENFKQLQALCERLASISGITSIVSIPHLKTIKKHAAEKRFVSVDIFPKIIPDQKTLDSLLTEVRKQKIYADRILNEHNAATIIFISIPRKILDSSEKIPIIYDILEEGSSFSKDTGIALHYAGIPLIRAVVGAEVKDEIKLFLILSTLASCLSLIFFFRSVKVMFITVIIVATAIFWVLGMMYFLDFRLTLLSVMIPPIMIVIGIPDVVYLVNKYHMEYVLHGNKIKAIHRAIHRVGRATLLTNLTTAIGFFVLLTTNMPILREFGIIAGVNVMITFFITIILVPTILLWMPLPSSRDLQHLKMSLFNRLLHKNVFLIQKKRRLIYIFYGLLLAASVLGIYKLHAVSYVLDDIPKNNTLQTDLTFFENSFVGIMPLEVVLSTSKKRGLIAPKNIKKIDQFQRFLESQPVISKGLSLVDFIKTFKQAFYNNNPAYYSLPSTRQHGFIMRYIQNTTNELGLLSSFVDSTYQTMRMSFRIADIGSHKMDSLIQQVVMPEMARIFPASQSIQATVTGSTHMLVTGNSFLIKNLSNSLIIAFLLIAIIMGTLFTNIRMVVICLFINLIPLVMTAGLMGFIGIPLKPSTVLVFSIMYGISVDFSIHFLVKYRQELLLQQAAVLPALTTTVLDIGRSMIYTYLVLFLGFIIFVFSTFGGTIALGILTVIALTVSLISTLLLLPALIIAFNHKKQKTGA